MYLKRLSRSKHCGIIYLVQRWTNWQCNWLSSDLFCSISILYFCGWGVDLQVVNMATCDSNTWNYDFWIKCECGRKFPVSPCFNYKVTSVRCLKAFYWCNVQSYLTYGKTACWPCLCDVLWHHSESHFICRFSLPQVFAGSCFDQLVSRIVT